MDLKFWSSFGILIIFVDAQLTFKKWQAKYNLSYTSNESDYNVRKQSFDVSVAFVCVNNLRYNFGYELGLNRFADVPFQQFQKSYSGLVLPNTSELGSSITHTSNQLLLANTVRALIPPTSVDYRNYSMPIKNQNFCNSCWAFAVIETLGVLWLNLLDTTDKIIDFQRPK